MKSKKLIVLMIIVAAMSVFFGSLSQKTAFAGGECAGDVVNFCPAAVGPNQVLGCLRQNFNQLSQPCQLHLAAVAEAVRETHQDCETDIYMLCLGVQPGGGRVIQCLKLNKDYVSPQCKAGIINLLETQRE